MHEPPPDKFVIFSGGKFEYRKGQDIVIAAYRHLMAKYPQVHLVCSWWNAWPQTMESMRFSQHIQIPTDPVFSFHGIMNRSGIPHDRYTLLNPMPNAKMAEEYRKCHMGLFLNRAEAGTNLPMMECMASGTPVIATYATGHIDVLGDTVPETKFQISTGKCIENGWFDADVKSAIDAVEYAILEPKRLEAVGALQRKRMMSFTWADTAQKLLEVCQC